MRPGGHPIKINVVALPDSNDPGDRRLARLTLKDPFRCGSSIHAHRCDQPNGSPSTASLQQIKEGLKKFRLLLP